MSQSHVREFCDAFAIRPEHLDLKISLYSSCTSCNGALSRREHLLHEVHEHHQIHGAANSNTNVVLCSCPVLITHQMGGSGGFFWV